MLSTSCPGGFAFGAEMCSFLCQLGLGVGQVQTEEGMFCDFKCWSQPWWPRLLLQSWISAVPSFGGNPRITRRGKAEMEPGEGQTGKSVWSRTPW